MKLGEDSRRRPRAGAVAAVDGVVRITGSQVGKAEPGFDPDIDTPLRITRNNHETGKYEKKCSRPVSFLIQNTRSLQNFSDALPT